MKYRYDGAVWNGNVIYKKVIEYVTAASKKQAIEYLKVRLKEKYKEITFIKLNEKNLSAWKN